MPVFQRKDTRGHFFQWGDSGKRYYFDPDSLTSAAKARAKARKQGQAVRARQRTAGKPYSS